MRRAARKGRHISDLRPEEILYELDHAFRFGVGLCRRYTSTMELRSGIIARRSNLAGIAVLAACVLGSALAPSATAENKVSAATETESLAERGEVAKRFVNERLGVWQQRLKLQEWRISVVMIRRDDLKPRTLGGIKWDKPKKSAVISVLDPSDYRLPIREMLDDIEMTIVHELVHLELASLPRSEASRSSEEHAVNGLAEALLALDRAKQ